ncbi:hypothetical protein ETB97_006297 [Aspergillus alliaceus]|uniref:Uncharacterized protein n=1 Tax=Petromyces alliaceus TaxID=209559 RepID=A0A5N6GE24_PETAA|nr:uncharacterized protein BDW43DRAFT_8030 [Aspergillus alliaceus]KAB8239584.1 hypothetical protein BDW43DRAFT_8030 [Aspergillus alliaceus]KAF5857054.1 hypothetical protein ETB97_006297 [Aspergillus burnettii]
MSRPQTFFDVEDWPLPPARRESTISSSTQSSSSASFVSSSFFPNPPHSPATSSPGRSRQASCQSMYDEVARLSLNSAVTISFVRSTKLFRLQYTYIDIRKDATGRLKALELGGAVGQQSPFLHTFNTSKIPVPHLEHPKLPNEPSLRISFMEEQTVQTAHTVFTSQLSYTFEDWHDCVQFQELILAAKLIFIAGIAEAKSKGRGEECISQNLRILRGYNGRQVLLFFANSQRKELKRYVSVPVNCIESVKPPKKAGRPVVLHLLPNFDHLTQMKTLQIHFLDDGDSRSFCQFLADYVK